MAITELDLEVPEGSERGHVQRGCASPLTPQMRSIACNPKDGWLQRREATREVRQLDMQADRRKSLAETKARWDSARAQEGRPLTLRQKRALKKAAAGDRGAG